MKLTFISNYYNHHQEELARAFDSMSNVEFYFIATKEIPAFRVKLGYKNMNHSAPFTIRAYESPKSMRCARRLVDESDVVICGAAPDSYIVSRLKQNKLTFRYSERHFKQGLNWKTFLSRFACILLKYKRFERYPLYVLAASAYTAADVNMFANFRKRCVKWGYFTKVDKGYKISSTTGFNSSYEPVKLMWCSRYIDWKHPELPVKLARCLKDKGYKFVLDMYGTGVELKRTQRLSCELGVCDVVNFCGVFPNEQILEQMKKHEIFLFTSDFNEGWGAVLNESMSCGCAVVASHAIGAVPFLVEDGVNGMIYENGNLDSFVNKVEYLLAHPAERFSIRQKAIQTMQEQWNAEIAASRFVQLSKQLLAGRALSDQYSDGVCSEAEELKNYWYIEKKY